jgi:hypothetical protein
MGNLKKVVAVLLLTALMTSCSSRGGIGTVSGTVTVDGKSVDTGTIHFRPLGDSNSKGAGALIEGGRFTLAANEAITAGTYNVVIQAFFKTGHIVKDPQKGDVAETKSASVSDMPKEVSITSDNYSNLEINFAGAKK